MILTTSAVLVEVIILAIMIMNNDSPTLARDTIYAAVMLDMNGIMGIAALIGGLKYGSQPYNDDSSKSYIAMILTAIGVSMIVPEFIHVDKWKFYSVFSIIMMVMLYALFLKMQTGQHSYFFSYTYADKGENHHAENAGSTKEYLSILVVGIIMIGFLAEIMTAIRTAMANRMQPVVNIALGASLSTVILTVPIIELIALIKNQPIEMALTPVQTVMVFITLVVAAINLNDGKTNAIEGMTHFVLFGTFIMLTFLGY